MLLALGNTDLGIAALERTAELIPNVAWLHEQLGRLLVRTSPARAAYHLDLALKLPNGQDATLWSLLGSVMLALGDFVRAHDAFRRSYQLDPDLKSRDLETRVHILHFQDRDIEAMLELQHALESQPDLSWANLALGQFLFANDYDDEALECLERALQTGEGPQLEPWLHHAALLYKGMALSQIGRYAQTVDVLEPAIELARARVERRQGLHAGCHRLGQGMSRRGARAVSPRVLRRSQPKPPGESVVVAQGPSELSVPCG